MPLVLVKFYVIFLSSKQSTHAHTTYTYHKHLHTCAHKHPHTYTPHTHTHTTHHKYMCTHIQKVFAVDMSFLQQLFYTFWSLLSLLERAFQFTFREKNPPPPLASSHQLGDSFFFFPPIRSKKIPSLFQKRNKYSLSQNAFSAKICHLGDVRNFSQFIFINH